VLIIHADVVGSTALSRQLGRDHGKALIRARLDAIDTHFLAIDPVAMVAIKRLGDATLIVGPDLLTAAVLRTAIAEAVQGDVRIALGIGEAVWTDRDDIEGAVVDLVVGRLAKACPPGAVMFDEGMAATLREQPQSLLGAFRERVEVFDGRETRVWIAQIGRATTDGDAEDTPMRHGNGNGNEVQVGVAGWGVRLTGRDAAKMTAIVGAVIVMGLLAYTLAPAALIVRGEHDAIIQQLARHDQRSAELFRAVSAMCHGVNAGHPRLLAACPPLPRIVEDVGP
jgi:hypothetical protein